MIFALCSPQRCRDILMRQDVRGVRNSIDLRKGLFYLHYTVRRTEYIESCWKNSDFLALEHSNTKIARKIAKENIQIISFIVEPSFLKRCVKGLFPPIGFLPYYFLIFRRIGTKDYRCCYGPHSPFFGLLARMWLWSMRFLSVWSELRPRPHTIAVRLIVPAIRQWRTYVFLVTRLSTTLKQMGLAWRKNRINYFLTRPPCWPKSQDSHSGPSSHFSEGLVSV